MPASSVWADFEGKKRPMLIAAIVLAVVFGGIFLWRTARQAASATAYARPPTEVSAIQVRAEALPQSLNATGSLQAVEQVLLASEVSGRVATIRFQAGQHAPAGAVLVQLVDGPERADRAAAVARQRFAQLQYDRSRELAATGAESRQLLQQREAELAQAQAAVLQIDARIAQKTVRAPFSGQLGLRRVNLGQFVNAGDPVATLTALDRLYVNFTVPQQLLSKLRVGGDVAVRSDAAPGQTFTARVNAVEPVVGGDTRNVSVQATMSNPDQRLRPGLYVTVSVAQPPRPGAILVPTTAVQTSASGDSVILVKGGKAVPVPVKAGDEVGSRTVIESGVRPGDVVVTTGQVRLQPDAPVKVAAAPTPAR